jgi:transcriptional regulator of acetoin/glycerol metabolism
MLRALEENGGNRVQAAIDVGIPRRTFYRRMKEYGLE